jgi:hypothetical protein
MLAASAQSRCPEHAANGRDDGGRAASASVTAFVIGIEPCAVADVETGLGDGNLVGIWSRPKGDVC